MNRILVTTSLISFLVFAAISSRAQDELSGEIDKLEKGQVESESVVPEDPTESAEEIESELNAEFGIPSNKKSKKKPEPVEEAPEEIPEEIASPESEPAPVVEETQSPEEQEIAPAPPAKKAQEFTPVTPPEPIIEAPMEEIVEEPAFPEEPPAPVVEEQPEPVPEPIEEPVQETPEPTYAESVPDDFEERMYRIYSQFYTEATSDASWTQIAGEKINETYTVQPGDTLWDISVTFFGNGHYWPKVWQMNDDITNPHNISTGYMLKFVPGQINQAPQLNITNNQETPIVPGTTELATKIEDPNATVAEAVPVIPAAEKRVPVLKELPPSLPYITGPRSEGFDKDGFDMNFKRPKIEDAKVYLTSYLSEEKPTTVGKIVEMNEADDETATLYETIFIEMENGAQIGEKLVVYTLGPKIYDTSGRRMGYAVIQEGEAQVQELVNQKKDVYKAIITRSIGTARIGSFVARNSLVVGNLNAQKASSPINAEIVGSTFDNEREVLGYQDLVYLNKGANEGFKPGQVFTVLKSVRDRKDSSMVEDLREQIAKIKILQTTPGRSTAIVLNSSQRVRPGDFIGSQAKLPGPAELKAIEERQLEEESLEEASAEDAASEPSDEFSDEESETEQESESDESELE